MNIAVTGLGIICAIGNNANEVLESLRQEKTGIGKMRYLQSTHAELLVGEVKLSDDELKAMLGIPADKLYSRTTLLGAVAVKQALADAGLTAQELTGKRVVLLSGTTVGGMDVTERLFDRMRTDDTVLSYINRHDCGTSTEEIAELCGLTSFRCDIGSCQSKNPPCEVCTISTACSSAINSIIVGCEMLRNDEADIVIAGGSEALSMFHLNGFNTLHILDTEVCRPFDKTRVGLNLGEGAAFVVLRPLETLEISETLETMPKAFVGGYGNKCDAYHQTASSENGEGAYLAMKEALSNTDPKQVDYVNAHGTGTPNNDPSESAALRRIFGDYMPPVSSTKGFTGHATSASGSIETVISIMAMQNNFVPVNYGFKEPDEACITPYNPSTLNPPLGSAACQQQEPSSLNHVLCNAFGFGGNDSSLLLCKHPVDLSPLTCTLNASQSHSSPEVEIVADITIDDMEQLADYKEYISPKEARRMGKLMKAATLTSLKALRHAGVACPDAIISATANGMHETSVKFLVDMVDNGEETLSPTLFMQSTHNTIGSAVAIRLQCHGYNITYTQGADSLKWALRDAQRLIRSGKAKTVLVGSHDESTPLFQSFCERLGQSVPPMIHSRSIVLTAKSSRVNRNHNHNHNC